MAIRIVPPLPDRDGLIRRVDLIAHLPFGALTLDRRIKDGTFPQPRKVGRSTWFDLGEVRTWMGGK